jgi:putative ABC transport system ATP-binding protein
MPSEISCRNVVKRYRRGGAHIEVLHHLDLDVARGEFLALMGPSGSGKTTLLNLIGGLDRPDEGEIRVAGTNIGALTSGEVAKWRARHIGFVFQFYNLMPTLSAARNIELPLLLTSLPRRDRRRRVSAVLELVGLSARAEHKPGHLSGGEQQRVAIARAMVADPDILACDEPTGDLDRKTADEILGLLQLLNQRGKTIMMVTHDARAADHASRTLNMDKGHLVGSSTGIMA